MRVIPNCQLYKSSYKLWEWERLLGWVCRLSESSLWTRLCQYSAYYPNSEGFGWEVISFARGNLDFDHSLSSIQLVWSQKKSYLVLWCCSIGLFLSVRLFWASSQCWWSPGYLNLRSYTTSFLPHSLNQNKLQDQTQISWGGCLVVSFDEGVTKSDCKRAYVIRCHCSPLWKVQFIISLLHLLSYRIL